VSRLKTNLGITLNPRVAARLDQYAEDEKLTRSMAIERILCKEFGIDLSEDPRTEMLLAQKDAEIEQLRAELEAVRNPVSKTIRCRVNDSALVEDRFTMEKG
jgi:hypothetical protein